MLDVGLNIKVGIGLVLLVAIVVINFFNKQKKLIIEAIVSCASFYGIFMGLFIANFKGDAINEGVIQDNIFYGNLMVIISYIIDAFIFIKVIIDFKFRKKEENSNVKNWE